MLWVDPECCSVHARGQLRSYYCCAVIGSGKTWGVTGNSGIFNVTLTHGETTFTGSCNLVSRRRRWSWGSHRVAMNLTWQAAETLGFFNVALDHMRGDVVGGKGGGGEGGGGAYLRKADLRGRLGGRGLPIVHMGDLGEC